jgi:hypothetical protein
MARRNTAELDAEYGRFKRFVLSFAEFLDKRAVSDPRPLRTGSIGPDGQLVQKDCHGPPILMVPYFREGIAELERTRPRGWRSGLRQAVQDLLEMSRDFSPADVRAADAALAQKGAPTLSTLRSEIWSTIPKILRRGRIKTESEYYLIIERLNDVAADGLPPQDRDRLNAIVAAFEQRKVKPGEGAA